MTAQPTPAQRRPSWAGDEHFGLRASGASRLAALRGRPVAPIAAAAFGVVVLAVIVIALTSSGGSASHATTTGGAQAAPSGGLPKPTVAVLNGTGVAGLGHQVGARVQRAGYRVGAVGDASGRQGSPSVVLYSPGDSQQAQLVARSLGVARTAPADSASEAQAHSAPVIVVVGPDMSAAGR